MAEIIVHKSHGHTSMSTYHLWDKTITLGAKGLLSQMFSLPDEWDFSIKGLIDLNQEGERAVTSALRELKTKGYLTVEKIPPSKGENKFTYLYNIYETPQTASPQDPRSVGVQNVGLQDVGIQDANQEKKEKKQKKEEKYISFNNNGFDSQDKEHSNNSNLNMSEVNYTIPIKSTTKQKKIDLKNKIIHLIDGYTDDEELRGAIKHFVQNREDIKKPVATEHSMELLLKTLTELSGGEKWKKMKIIENAEKRNWLDFYPLKPDECVNPEYQHDLDDIF